MPCAVFVLTVIAHQGCATVLVVHQTSCAPGWYDGSTRGLTNMAQYIHRAAERLPHTVCHDLEVWVSETTHSPSLRVIPYCDHHS